MCRSIKRLHNLTPSAKETEIEEAALQFVRKIYGSTKPTKSNETAFYAAVKEIAEATKRLLSELEANGSPVTREELRERQKQRFERQTNGRTLPGF